GRLTVKGDMTGPTSAQMVLRDPSVDCAVMETARGGLLRSGMGYTRCDVGACLNIAADHLGLKGIDTLEQLAEVKRVIVEVATDTAVLNADDVHCLEMADYTQAEHLCYVTMNPGHDLVREHIRAGGRAVVLEKGINGEMITFYDNGAHIPVLWTHLIPATLEGKAMHNVQNAMFAAAIAYSLGKSLEDIRHGLRTFDTTFFQAPGRMNFFDEHPFKVLLDFAHNPAAVQMICRLVDRLDVEGRRIGVLAAPGDRRDEDIREIAQVAAGHFDHYFCKADDRRRGRGYDEVPQMLRQTLLDNGVSDDQVEVIPDEVEAVDAALHAAHPGDLVVIFGDEITRCWKQVIHFNPDVAEPVTQATPQARPQEDGYDVEAFVLDDHHQLVRDERGVRLAREEGD
ncbi:MAG: cyanophycin synthetase, partial [Bacteroidetes bacterium]|nr:cyanophycin synthetase [Bacteroidota bacterium]